METPRFNVTNKMTTAEILRDMTVGESVIINGRTITYVRELVEIEGWEPESRRAWKAGGVRYTSLLRAMTELTRGGAYNAPDGEI